VVYLEQHCSRFSAWESSWSKISALAANRAIVSAEDSKNTVPQPMNSGIPEYLLPATLNPCSCLRMNMRSKTAFNAEGSSAFLDSSGFCIISPYSRFRLVWDVVSMVCLFYNLVVVPVRLGWDAGTMCLSLTSRKYAENGANIGIFETKLPQIS
jgi:hypothetical protein